MIETIPEGWEETTILECCEILDSQRIPITKSKREPGNVPYYGATGRLDFVKDFIFDEELVLVGEDGADWSAWAKTAYIIKGKSWVNNHAHVLRCKTINSIFLRDSLNMADLRNYINGTTRGKLNQENLRKIKILNPPLPEQEKIANILSKTDEQIQLTEEIIAKTEELKKGLMQELLTKGIGHTDFDEVNYYGKLIKLPKIWELTNIKDIGKVNTGITPPTNDKSNYGHDYMFITPADIGNFKDLKKTKRYLSEKGYSGTKKIPKNSLLVVCIGSTIGKMCINKRDCSSNQQINYIEFKENNHEFIYYMFKMYDFIFKKYSGNVAVPIINKTTFENLQLPVSKNIEEQKRIASILSSIDAQIQDNILELERLQEVKKGLMQDLLTGKVRVKV